MPFVLRTATPGGDWRSFAFICDESAGLLGQRNAWAAGLSWLYQVEDSVGVLIEDADFGEKGVLWYEAEKIIVPKMIDSEDVFLPGQAVYWDPVSRLCSAEADSTYYRIGVATEPAAAADRLLEIDLDGGCAAIRP